ncbi:hypothetical protein [Mesomycoplasma lagogenitalium]|uniref:Uncharacterized protein n=1 Tax=Mesomycoplasma lagogenitalium TaxID=171286 RepID=A0ABY8LTA8_9BACT|nr:hypothetical protein [Mesomycoplasma lagogenitalium]WGI36484.1 hypothetical protein QEG99_03400 [Mesomycoplasma lagogenitalium]
MDPTLEVDKSDIEAVFNYFEKKLGGKSNLLNALHSKESNKYIRQNWINPILTLAKQYTPDGNFNQNYKRKSGREPLQKAMRIKSKSNKKILSIIYWVGVFPKGSPTSRKHRINDEYYPVIKGSRLASSKNNHVIKFKYSKSSALHDGVWKAKENVYRNLNNFLNDFGNNIILKKIVEGV